MAAPEAPARFRYSPRMLRAPSWVMSENRLTTPISVIKATAPRRYFLFPVLICFSPTLPRHSRFHVSVDYTTPPAECNRAGRQLRHKRASASTHGWSCPRPLQRATISALCATSRTASRGRNEKSRHPPHRKTVPSAIRGGPFYDHEDGGCLPLRRGGTVHSLCGNGRAAVHRAFRRGDPVRPIDIDKQQYASVHGENKNISVDKPHLAVDFYRALLRNYPADAR